MRNAHAINLHVGECIRRRRTSLGISQQRLAEILGISFQQVQKYERGVNRMSVERLCSIAEALETAVGALLPTAPSATGDGGDSASSGRGQNPDAAIPRREALGLIRHYSRIKNEAIRRRAYEVVRTLADADAKALEHCDSTAAPESPARRAKKV